RGGRAEPDQAAAAGGLERAAGSRPGRARLRADRAARARGGGGDGRLPVARGGGRRGGRGGPGPRRMRTRDGLPAGAGDGLVWLYRLTFGALFPTTCKYHPSCSEYAVQALRRHGLVKGSVLAGWRLLRCNPWSHGGFDPVR